MRGCRPSHPNRTPENGAPYGLVEGAIGGDAETIRLLAEDIFIKTDGLAKDVEYCLRQYALELGHGAQAGAIEGLLSTIDRLPLIHRQFLVIAALLDGGVKKAIARGTVSRLTSAYDAAQLDGVVDDLVARDYLRLNSESGDRLRPGHERIVIAIRDLADDELQEEVRRSLIEELAIALEEPSATRARRTCSTVSSACRQPASLRSTSTTSPS